MGLRQSAANLGPFGNAAIGAGIELSAGDAKGPVDLTERTCQTLVFAEQLGVTAKIAPGNAMWEELTQLAFSSTGVSAGSDADLCIKYIQHRMGCNLSTPADKEMFVTKSTPPGDGM